MQKSIQALIKNHAVLVTSGQGFPVDSGMLFFRGTAGLWKNYKSFKKNGISYN